MEQKPISKEEQAILDLGFYEGIQDCSAVGNFPTYHTHGPRQYYGTCKYHKKLDCPVLKRWKPFKVRGKSMGKTVMREWFNSEEEVSVQSRCKVCWK